MKTFSSARLFVLAFALVLLAGEAVLAQSTFRGGSGGCPGRFNKCLSGDKATERAFKKFTGKRRTVPCRKQTNKTKQNKCLPR